MTQDENRVYFMNQLGLYSMGVNGHIRREFNLDAVPPPKHYISPINWDLVVKSGSIHVQRTESLLSKAGRTLRRLLKRDRD